MTNAEYEICREAVDGLLEDAKRRNRFANFAIAISSLSFLVSIGFLIWVVMEVL